MSLRRWWWLILFLVVLSGAFAPSEAGAVSPDDVWTEEKRKALVWLKIMLDSGKPSYGTGFLVQGRRGQLYVLTATHVVQGNIAPKDYTRGNWELNQGSELRLELGGGDSLASDYVINLFNGDKPLEVSAVRLRPRSSLLPLPISFAPIGKADTLSLAGFPRGQGTPEIRSGEVKALVSPLKLEVSENIAYNADMMVVNINTVEGESGGPYLDRNGVAVGLHFGAVMNRGGHAHLIPFASISSALDALEIGPVPRNGGQPRIKGTVLVLGYAEEKRNPLPSRVAKQHEAEVVYEGSGFGSRHIRLSKDDGGFEAKCESSTEMDAGKLKAEDLTGANFVGREADAVCGRDIELTLTHPARYGATQIDMGNSEVIKFASKLPKCWRDNVSRSPIKYLSCRLSDSGALTPFDQQIETIKNYYQTAIDRGADFIKPEAQRSFGNFIAMLGNPCQAKDLLRAAASAPTQQGPQAANGWIDALLACADDKDNDNRMGDVLKDLSDVAEDSNAAWVDSIRAPFLTNLRLIIARLNAQKILGDDTMYRSWVILQNRVVRPSCSLVPSGEKTEPAIAASIANFENAMNTGKCRAKLNRT